MPRKTITDMIPDIDAPEPEPGPGTEPARVAPPPARAPARREQRDSRQASRQVPHAPARDAARPSARELVTPARPPVAREALKADVPADLALLHRLRRYRLDTGTDIRDQVAIAVDEWLTSQGY
jgi:hypothetical protein